MLRVLLIYGVKSPRDPEVVGSRGPVFTVCPQDVLDGLTAGLGTLTNNRIQCISLGDLKNTSSNIKVL